MNKDVVIEVVGKHTTDGENEVIRSKCNGQYYEKNGKYYFLYEELTENGKVKNIIKVDDRLVEVIKKGSANAHLFYQVGETVNCSYDTPFGCIPIGINTERLNIYKENHHIKVVVSYVMLSDEKQVARCKLQIEARE